jgi:putative DNA primase/helicase
LPETFEISAKVFLSTNHKPKIKDSSEGIWRRIRLIPFNYIVPKEKRIKDFGKILFEENPSGLLNWLIDGYNGYKVEGLTLPEIVKKNSESYRQKEDDVGQFLLARCINRDGDTCYSIQGKSLFEEYKKYSGHEKTTLNFFYEALENHDIKRDERYFRDGVHFYGISLKDDNEFNFEETKDDKKVEVLERTGLL